MCEQADGGASGLFKPPSKRHARGQDPQGDSRLTSSRRNLSAHGEGTVVAVGVDLIYAKLDGKLDERLKVALALRVGT